MEFAPSTGFGYFNRLSRHADGKRQERDKEMGAFPTQTRFTALIPNGFNDEDVRFLPPHLKLYFLYLYIGFSNLHTFKGCAEMPCRRNLDHRSSFSSNHFNRILTLAQLYLSNNSSYLGHAFQMTVCFYVFFFFFFMCIYAADSPTPCVFYAGGGRAQLMSSSAAG